MRIDQAIHLAFQAHEGQVDKTGRPYILHPLRVMMAVPDDCKIPAVLHDVLEDTKLTYFDLEYHGVSQFDRNIVQVLTKSGAQSYFEYIRRVRLHPEATLIKIADIEDNSLPWRQTPEIEGMVKTRYAKALRILRGEEE